MPVLCLDPRPVSSTISFLNSYSFDDFTSTRASHCKINNFNLQCLQDFTAITYSRADRPACCSMDIPPLLDLSKICYTARPQATAFGHKTPNSPNVAATRP